MSEHEWPEVWCQKCGVSSRDRAMKYCGDGRDKDNEHVWKQTKPKKTRYKPVLLSELNQAVARVKTVDDAYRRGFEAAKVAASQLVMIERHIAEETGHECDLSHLEDLIVQLEPEVTQ